LITLRLTLMVFVALLMFPTLDIALSAVAPLDSRVIVDSEEPFDRRVYNYDMALDSNGDIHIIYAKPTNNNYADVFYINKTSGLWMEQPVLITPFGFAANTATYISIGNDNSIHICYIKKEPAGSVHLEALYYSTIANGARGPERFVEGGGWFTKMQLEPGNYPVFVRGEGQEMVLLTTNNGTTWSRSVMNIPQVPYRLADFLYSNGEYHLTYGDNAYIKPVWTRSGTLENGVFHNFYYATSSNGTDWDVHLLDDSGVLYEFEFWTSLVLANGMPVIGMYRYDQYNNNYNMGSYIILSKKIGSSWIQKIITDRSHPDLTEGMGIGLAVYSTNDYFAAWDFSPVNTYNDDFRGERGNIALVRSGSDGEWTSKWQLDPFSLEGKALVKIHGDKLCFLGLGDFVDSKLYYREYNVRTFVPPSPPPNTGTFIIPTYQLLLDNK
jgi:hypothetical protein